MADKQTGSGAKANTSHRPKGQGESTKGNHDRSSDNNRSQQIKDQNRSENKTDRTR